MSSATDGLTTLQLERVPCPLCGDVTADLVVRGGDNLCGLPGEFSVERCRGCRHMFMNPRPVLESLAACYPAHYGPHRTVCSPLESRSGEAVRAQPWYLRYLPLRYVPGLRRFFYWLTDDKSQPSPVRPVALANGPPCALEIGCATGRYLQRLAAEGWSAQGIEPGDQPAATARATGLNVTTGILESTPVADGSVDAAAAWMVIEHVPDPRTTLSHLRRVLKPGGQLLISIPNAGCWEPSLFDRHWYVWELPRHLHHFTPVSIRRLLQECGFESIQVVHQRSLLNVIGSLGIAMLSRWPNSPMGLKLKSYPDNPTLTVQLLLAIPAQLLAFLRQGGRLTVIARAGVNRSNTEQPAE